jgi:CRP-like cAMP-binding protein
MQDQAEHYEVFRSVAEANLISEEEWCLFTNQTTLQTVKKGEYLVRAGDEVIHAYYCTKGLFRLFYTLEDGKEFNKSFSFENDFVTSYGAMIKKETSHFSIQAIEESVVIVIPYSTLQKLTEQSHAWERLLRHCVEQLYLKKEERERELLYLDATRRYKAFINKYPNLVPRLTQYHIASYLGISAVSLSRLMHADKS